MSNNYWIGGTSDNISTVANWSLGAWQPGQALVIDEAHKTNYWPGSGSLSSNDDDVLHVILNSGQINGGTWNMDAEGTGLTSSLAINGGTINGATFNFGSQAASITWGGKIVSMTVINPAGNTLVIGAASGLGTASGLGLLAANLRSGQTVGDVGPGSLAPSKVIGCRFIERAAA